MRGSHALPTWVVYFSLPLSLFFYLFAFPFFHFAKPNRHTPPMHLPSPPSTPSLSLTPSSHRVFIPSVAHLRGRMFCSHIHPLSPPPSSLPLHSMNPPFCLWRLQDQMHHATTSGYHSHQTSKWRSSSRPLVQLTSKWSSPLWHLSSFTAATSNSLTNSSFGLLQKYQRPLSQSTLDTFTPRAQRGSFTPKAKLCPSVNED